MLDNSLGSRTLEELMEGVQSPSDLGFDSSKFPGFREGQLETAKQVVQSERPLFLVEAPTGVGKSLLAMTVHKLLGKPRAAYLVSTKQLQDQIEEDFGVPVLKGRSNYPCLKFLKFFPDVTSEICREYLGDNKCEFERDCPYLQQKRAALSAPICVLNYPLFFTEANFVGGFSNLKFLVLDECDTVEDHLMNFVEVPITQRLLHRLGVGLPKFKTKLESWESWLKLIEAELTREIGQIGPADQLPITQLRDLIRLKRTYRRILSLIDNLNENWVMELGDEKSTRPVVFKPVKVAGFANSYLWRHTERSVGMSATVLGPSAMALDLGLHSWDADSVSLQSPFPVKSRTINYIPVADVTRKTQGEAYPRISDAIDHILSRHSNENVLVHCVSYDFRNFLRDYMRPANHVVMTHDSDNRARVLEEFKSSKKPAVLVSPSMDRGVNLPGDTCRVIIVAKIPYPNLGSPQVNKRLYSFSDGNLWYSRRAIRSLIQMTGRATRSSEDYSVSYILDEQFMKIVSRHNPIFPDWWASSVRMGSLEGEGEVSG